MQTCSWLPVDILASSILDLLTATPRPPILSFYNLTSPRHFHWTRDLLPLLSRTPSAPTFTAVDTALWLAALRKYSEKSGKAGPDESNRAVRRNPAVKLLEYFEGMYGAEKMAREKGEVMFSTEGAERDSRALGETPDVLGKGLLGKFVEAWVRKWDVEDGQ